MKKKEFFAEIRLVLRTYFIFFILCAFVVTASFLMFFHAIQLPEEQIRAAAPMTLITVLTITAIFVTIDTVRRKITVGRPVKKNQACAQTNYQRRFLRKASYAGKQFNFCRNYGKHQHHDC